MKKISDKGRRRQARSSARRSPKARRPAPRRRVTTDDLQSNEQILAAIDVGTNAVRLEMVRPQPIGSLEILHQERDPLRPGEGVFRTGFIPREVADRLMSTLRRYAALCRRFHARVRAVATSAVREARNRDEIVRRAHREAGLVLEVVSGREEARLIALGVLHGRKPNAKALVIDIGGGSTELATAVGERPLSLYSVAVGAVRLTELFGSTGKISEGKLTLMRSFAAEAFHDAVPRRLPAPRAALGSSGTVQTLVAYAAAPGTAHATTAQIAKVVDDLAEMTLPQRRKRFDAKRAEIIVAGAVILEALMQHLDLASITAVDRGLRDGLLIDLLDKANPSTHDQSFFEATLAMGERFHFDERHARQVARLALTLFDDLATLHRLPASTRPLLEVAALLHDVGNAVSYQRHHKHSYYLIQNADLPGFTDRERELAARIARYHRRSTPERAHIGMEGLSESEFQSVRKLATLLRLADSFDRSHHQPVQSLRAFARPGAVVVQLRARAPLDLEIWDAQGELPLFRRVFGRSVEIRAMRRGTS
jgi:exopolyphosphatase / guanosine-5'-triphosphate,3'-diphosphate pyrophosphatase